MKHYKIKKLVNGYRVSPLLKTRTLVALPYINTSESISVLYNNETMIVNRETPLLHQESFKDKFGRNRNYTLYYYEWCPNENQQRLF